MCNFEQTALGSCRKIAGIHWGFRGLSRATRQRAKCGCSARFHQHPFPRRRAEQHALGRRMGQAFRAPKRTILCIDDDHAILAYQRALLEGMGYEVLASSSAYHGIAMATVCSVDAVVLDYHMPELDGHHVAVAIKQCQPGISIVMFSGGEVPEETRNLVDAVVLKTEAIEHLLATIAQLCNRPSAERRGIA